MNDPKTYTGRVRVRMATECLEGMAKVAENSSQWPKDLPLHITHSDMDTM